MDFFFMLPKFRKRLRNLKFVFPMLLPSSCFENKKRDLFDKGLKYDKESYYKKGRCLSVLKIFSKCIKVWEIVPGDLGKACML